MYVGIMPSGMKAAIKRLNEGMELHNFIDEICRKAKIRHPNLVRTVGCCDSGDGCLVYEYVSMVIFQAGFSVSFFHENMGF